MIKLKNPAIFIDKNLIDGQWLGAGNDALIAVNDPATGQLIGHVPDIGVSGAKKAIAAANQALSGWRAKTAGERALLLKKWYDLIMMNLDDLAAILTSEQGKPLTEAKNEIKYAAAFVEWFAQEAHRVYGHIIPAHLKDSRILVTKEPVGVCGLITPWNFPAAMITRKAAPAIACGCTVVIKPAAETPFTALALAKLSVYAGIDKGVINVITGDGAQIGKELTSNNLVRKISFTGSTAVGKLLMADCASSIKRLSLELGGNAPLIVFDDADLDAAVNGAIASKYRNTGQTCICTNRLIIHQKIYDQFVLKLAKEISKLKVGNGFEDGVQQGPLINKKALNHCCELVEDARKKGAKIILGGNPHQLGNNFFEPTIIADATSQMRFYSEEIFGPIAAVYKFKNEAQAIEIANDTRYGLASYIYSADLNKALRVADQLEYGMVGINEVALSTTVAPFGGVKESGIGREGSFMGIEEYLETKYILARDLDK